jgi:predicted outer membrane repeat protein
MLIKHQNYMMKTGKNTAFGGALYISGREIDENRKIEIGLGVNDSIRIADGPNGFVSMQSKDFIIFENNQALTRQPLLAVINSKIRNNRGSKGGALYIGDYTSVIFSGTVRNNRTSTPYLNNDNSEFLSLGGGIYHDNTLGRLQVRGHINSLTEFSGNTAAAGGAIHVNGNTDPRPSPIIGGSDVANPRLRDYGRRIVFQNNSASAHGGAVYTNRNMMVHGAGGIY